MNFQELKTYRDNNEINLEYYVEKLDLFIDLEEQPNILNQVYKIALHYNKRAEFNNTGELYSVEKKLCKHYNQLFKDYISD